MADSIPLRGVRVHNLRGIDVDIPLGRLTVVCGVSGAGKSSLAFDTLYAEAQRRYLQSFSAYTRQFLERFDQPDADFIGDLPPAIAVSQRSLSHSPRATVGTVTEVFDYLRLLLVRAGVVHCLKCGQVVKAQTSADVLATIESMPAGTRLSVAFPAPVDGDLESLREEGFVRVQIGTTVHRLDESPQREQGLRIDTGEKIWVLVDRFEVGKTVLQRLTDSLETAFARGQGRLALLGTDREYLFDQRLLCPRCEILYPFPEPGLFHFNDPRGACPLCQGTGVKDRTDVCPACLGTRLGEQTNYVLLAGKSLRDLCRLTLIELATMLQNLTPTPMTAMLLDSLRTRLGFLLAVELGYLTLDRSAHGLSTGEARRVRLTTALGSNLVSALYIFDEPTAGLHARDTHKVLAELTRLREAGNTLVVVDNHVDVLRAADHVIDLGPGAGEEGGEVLFQGPLADSDKSDDSLAIPSKRRPTNHGALRVVGARLHNLQDITVDFPLGVLCVVTGVSGAGKTSLVQHTLYAGLAARKKKGEPVAAEIRGADRVQDVILMDQENLGRVGRSNPATYLKIFDDIRKLFAETAEARFRNYGPGHFSFNQPGGRCETCEGQGVLTVDMQFLADVSITCPECLGSRFQKAILEIKVRSLSIAEVLNLTAREAFRFFRAQPSIERRLKFLLDVGLDYLRLGQPASTLSGGESQRLKLAGHLASSRKPRSLFILLEPTIGLHPADVTHLLDCFDRLLATGHSLIVVEHNLDIIKCADHLIDLGPGAGPEGGRVVATGPPEAIAEVAESATGECLRRLMLKKRD